MENFIWYFWTSMQCEFCLTAVLRNSFRY